VADKSLRGTFENHRLIVALTFDFDAESWWVGPAKMTSPSAISRGSYGARESVPRVLKLLEKYELHATFFIPGYTAEQHPEEVRAIARAGHEIGHHGYLHEPPNLLTEEQEEEMPKKGMEALEKVTGKRPFGFRSPSAELSPNTLSLLIDMGFIYDSSMMGSDRPYLAQDPKRDRNILEIPMSVELTDTPHFMFLYHPIVLPGLSSPSKVEEIWRGDFDGLYAECGDAVFNLTCHPQVIGRPHRMQMLERFIRYMFEHEGVWFARMLEIADCATMRASKGIEQMAPPDAERPRQ
jgi:peptidoglycan/xylan/chitin deacetylase (PgdA/CDA1 family)